MLVVLSPTLDSAEFTLFTPVCNFVVIIVVIIIIRPHGMHRLQSCGLLLPMINGLCDCLLDITMNCANRLNQSRCRLGLWTLVGLRNHVIGWGQDFPRRGNFIGDDAPCYAAFCSNS